jgi:hypothetical protein
MRPIPAILGALTAIAIYFFWPFGKERPTEEIVKTPTIVTARLYGTTDYFVALEYDWKRHGPDAVANFSVENRNDFEVTSIVIACYLFDKDAKPAGTLKREIKSSLAANSKTSFSGVLFRNVEPHSRTAICDVDDALPKMHR